MIRFTGFDILTLVKSSCFFVFFLRGYLGFITRSSGPSTLYLLFIGLFLSHDRGHGFSRLTQST